MHVFQMYKAGDIASSRGAKMIGIEDILFLMRKDKVRAMVKKNKNKKNNKNSAYPRSNLNARVVSAPTSDHEEPG